MACRHVVFLGLDPSLRDALSSALAPGAVRIDDLPSFSSDETLQHLLEQNTDLVCCAADPTLYPRLVEIGRKLKKPVRFVVASARREPNEWYQAVRGGATDYFGPPFEPWQVRSVFNHAARSAPMTAHFVS